MIKFRTNEEFLNFIAQLKQLYEEDNSDEEEDEVEKDQYAPKVIDSRYNSTLLKKNISEEEYLEAKEYGAELVSSMPRDHYTTDYTIPSIVLTCTIKNSGKKEWPTAFKIGLLNCPEEVINRVDSPDEIINTYPMADRQVKPGHTIDILVTIMNPKISGTFTYSFSLFKLNGVPFGTPFDFTFTIKNTSAAFIQPW